MTTEHAKLSDAQRLAYLDAMGVDVWRPVADEAASAEVDPMSVAADHPAWETLEQQVRTCVRCPLHTTRTQAVFGVGNRQADWMIVGEAPGVEEDQRGEPFIGRAGQLLDRMLAAVNLSRELVFIANILKCRPPGNRDPQQSEADQCRDYLEQQIALLQPKMILAVGRIAAQQLLRRDDAVGKLRGELHELSGIPLVVTYHPAYLLRRPSQKAQAWIDLCLARDTFNGVTR